MQSFHLYEYLASFRVRENVPAPLAAASERVSPRHVASIILKKVRKAEEQSLLNRLHAHSPLFSSTATIADGFVRIIRSRTDQAEEALNAWVQEAILSSIPALASFARGLRADWSAVVAGLSLDWNNGPVEGSVNRITMIAREMYGRANFDLLRRRVMAP